eukprot:scaffold6057_cov112-Isochrysis_galbana.AAC.4
MASSEGMLEARFKAVSTGKAASEESASVDSTPSWSSASRLEGDEAPAARIGGVLALPRRTTSARSSANSTLSRPQQAAGEATGAAGGDSAGSSTAAPSHAAPSPALWAAPLLTADGDGTSAMPDAASQARSKVHGSAPPSSRDPWGGSSCVSSGKEGNCEPPLPLRPMPRAGERAALGVEKTKGSASGSPNELISATHIERCCSAMLAY